MKDWQPVLVRVQEALRQANAHVYLCGSLASSLHGVFRATSDIDLVTDLRIDQVDAFQERLGSDFYMDFDAACDAIARGRLFNVIHIPSGWKVDLYTGVMSEFDSNQMERAKPEAIPGEEGELVQVRVATAEDTILSKLRWYVLSRGSKRQWDDIAGVVLVRGPELDREYLRRWAARLGVSDLLEKLLAG